MTQSASLPDVRKTIAVAASVAEAFRIYTRHPAEWLPPGHLFIRPAGSVAMEPFAGGRFYERSADGSEAVRGTVLVLAVLSAPGPGETLTRYAEVVARHAGDRPS